jgi:hypothetical protein
MTAFEGTSRVILGLLGPCALGALVWVVTNRGDLRGSSPADPPESPFPRLSSECPISAKGEDVAREMARSARLTMHRYPYDPAEGVRAVGLMLRTASCYERTGLAGTAESAQSVAATWRRTVEREYRAALLEMRLATKRADRQSALEAVRSLRRFLVDTPGAFLTELERLERYLESATLAGKVTE